MAEPKYLIHGGARYFGARLAENLRCEAQVTVTGRRISDTRKLWAKNQGIELLAFDSSDTSEFKPHGDFDAIINLAMPGAAEASLNPETARKRGLAGVEWSIEQIKQGRAFRLLHFSTFHVYGAGGSNSYNEDDKPNPTHPYGQAHLACEQRLIQEESALVVRPSNMVGCPAHNDLGDQAKLLFLDLCRQAAQGKIQLSNDGLSFRDFVPFSDAIAAVKALLRGDDFSNYLFNLASGVATRLDEAVQLIVSATPRPLPELSFGNGIDSFRSPFTISTRRLRSLGWTQQADLKGEAAMTIQFFR